MPEPREIAERLWKLWLDPNTSIGELKAAIAAELQRERDEREAMRSNFVASINEASELSVRVIKEQAQTIGKLRAIFEKILLESLPAGSDWGNSTVAELAQLGLKESAQAEAPVIASTPYHDFFAEVWPYHTGTLEGPDISEMAVRLGLVREVEVTEACGEGCQCAAVGNLPGTCLRVVDQGEAPDPSNSSNSSGADLSPERVDAKFSTGENTRQDASREMVGSNPACDPPRREIRPGDTVEHVTDGWRSVVSKITLPAPGSEDYLEPVASFHEGGFWRLSQLRKVTPAAETQAPPERGAAQLCLKCGKTEVGWRYNRCPNCGEMADDAVVVPKEDQAAKIRAALKLCERALDSVDHLCNDQFCGVGGDCCRTCKLQQAAIAAAKEALGK